MTDPEIEQARFNMIEQQVRTWEVLDQRVLDVLARVPREDFVPERLRRLAFSDIKLPLGHGQVMMTPSVEGRMLQALAIEDGDGVLEIGTGSGFTTACLAALGGRVSSIDIRNEFTEQARTKLGSHGFDNVELRTEDAMQPWRQTLTYEAIAVTGGVAEVPPWFKESMSIGGRMFVIVGKPPVMEARLVTRAAEGHWLEEGLFETEIPYLTGAAPRQEFEF
jgi:protein-L-isoaspartate(D-aspartate) O-methyltransferase